MKEHENILVFCNGKLTYHPQMQNRNEGGIDRARYVHNDHAEKSDVYRIRKKATQKFADPSKRYPSSVQQFNRERGFHPTQKPVKLLEYLIKTYSNEGDLILDNCMGSGSTGVACIKTERNFIGIELNQKYYDIATQRIKDADGLGLQLTIGDDNQ